MEIFDAEDAEDAEESLDTKDTKVTKIKTMKACAPVAILVAALFLPCSALAASFPCEKATTAVEKTICGDKELSALDEQLGRYYSAARAAVKPADSCLVGDQRNWLRAQRNACKDAGCLKRVYLKRLAELDPLQPGVTRIRSIELPAVDALAWIVPAAQDQVAAPVNQQAKPLVARGTLLDEVAGGDGYVLRTGDGKRLLIVPLMFLVPSTAQTLAALAKVGGSYEARGYAEAGSGGSVHFAPGRCVFIYRIR